MGPRDEILPGNSTGAFVLHMKTDTIVNENLLISFDVTLRERGIIHRHAFIVHGADSITWIFDCDAPSRDDNWMMTSMVT